MPGAQAGRRRGPGRRAVALLAAVATVVGVSAASGAWQPAGAATPGVRGTGPALRGPEVAVPHHETGTYDFDAGWRFRLLNPSGVTDPTGISAVAARPGYDDTAWRAVHVPHDWSIERNPTAEPPATSGTGFYEGGLGWYRKSVVLPPTLAGKQLSLEFDGVYMDSDVFLNGVRVGGHHYGYTGFSVPLTGAHTDGHTTDVVAVQVRNDVPSSRWYSGSGIYRNVRLVATDPVHVARLGSTVTTPDLERTLPRHVGTVHVATEIAPTATPQRVQVVTSVQDPEGRTVARGRSTVTTGAAAVTATTDLTVYEPRLWSPGSPTLYHLSTLVQVAGRTTDSYEQRFGFRWTRTDPQAGLFLNGQPLKLQGVDLHHTEGALGAAVDRDELRRQLTTMKAMGVNALRTAHNPPAPELVQLCDELGILMMVEAFDVWDVAKVPNDYARFFDTDADADIAEMVRESRTSPSVLMWSIGNEIPNSTTADGVPIARRLIADVKALDTTRPVVIGSDKYRSVPDAGSPAEQILQMLDGVGLNYNTAESVDQLHARYPRTFFFESESSSETSTRGAYDQPGVLNTGEDHTPGDREASSYDNNLESWTMSGEYALKKDRDRPWFLGQFLWSGIDYIGEPTPFDVYPVKTSFFGAVDTALFPKDQYYLFQSQWSATPMVHLLPMNWTDHQPGSPVQVWAYSNAPSVELFLDGRSLGVRSFDEKTTSAGRDYLETTEPTGDDQTVTGGRFPGSYTGTDGTAGHLHLTWTVPFAPGHLVAVARDGGGQVARDEVDTAGPAAAVRLTPDRASAAGDDATLVHVEADVVDAHGVVVPSAQDLISFAVTGGRLVGVDNGRQESQESYKESYRTAFHGKALAILTPTGPGPLTLTATAPGLASGSARVQVQPVAGPVEQGLAPPSYFTPYARKRPVPDTQVGIGPVADASFSGSEETVPAALVDGDTTGGGWSNAYSQPGTALLPPTSAARTRDWVSVTLPAAARLDGLTAWFVADATHALPATVQVQALTADGWQPVQHQGGSAAAGGPTRFSFTPVTTAALRLVMTSSAPLTDHGFLQVRELTADRA